MDANSFIDWLKGFLAGKSMMTKEQVEFLKAETEKVTKVEDQYSPAPPGLTPTPSQPLIDWDLFLGKKDTCPYPDNCGMPQVWHGVVPPTCMKCGKQGQTMDIYCGQPTTGTPPDVLPSTTSITVSDTGIQSFLKHYPDLTENTD